MNPSFVSYFVPHRICALSVLPQSPLHAPRPVGVSKWKRPPRRRARALLSDNNTPLDADNPSENSTPDGSSLIRPRSFPTSSVVFTASDPHAPGCLDSEINDGIISTGFWDWKGFGRVRYLYSAENAKNKDKPIVLFVPGFGVCAADYLDNLPVLAKEGYLVFAMDKLGLGASEPASVDVARLVTLKTWRDQIVHFIEEVLDGRPVYIAGNSLGGLLSASVASVRGDLIRGAILLSPAPFWVMMPPKAPALLRAAIRILVRTSWKRLTNVNILRKTLALVYARPENIPERLIENILRPTRYEHAKEVFESVLTSPALEHGFEESIFRGFGDGEKPLAIIYGRQDPWVVPMFGLRIKALVDSCTYYELSPCGHCAHAEVPNAVNAVMSNWLSAVTRGERPPDLGGGPTQTIIGDVSVLSRDHMPRSALERLVVGQNYAVVFLAAYLSTFIES